MGFDDNEHYPFLCIGKKHILDDPSCLYMRSYDTVSTEYQKELAEQIEKTLMDNYKILCNCNNQIFILPVRLFSEIDQDVIATKAESAFLELFQNLTSIKEYFEKVRTFEDVEKYLQPGAAKRIYFNDDNDSHTIPLKQRLERFISNNSFPVEIENTNTNYGQFLFWGIYSVIAQALDVLFLSICYKMIPYIRYRPTFMYLMIILSNMDEKDELLELKYKACIMHVIQKRAELIEFSTDTATFISALKDYRFEYNLFQQLAISGNIKHEFHIQEISNLVDIELEKLLTFCSK